MDKQFLELLEKAKNLSVLDEGSKIIFTDYIYRCEAQISKNIEMINRLAGKNDQLRITSALLGDVIRKYIRLQEDADIASRQEAEFRAEIDENLRLEADEEINFKEKDVKEKKSSKKKKIVEEV